MLNLKTYTFQNNLILLLVTLLCCIMLNISFTNANCVCEPMDGKYKQAVKNMADILTKKRQGTDAHTHTKTTMMF